jgi:hypothetical protein
MRRRSNPPVASNVDAATLAALQCLPDVAIERARAGDADAGMDAVALWLDARRRGIEAPELEAHFERCMEDVKNGVPADVALCIRAAGARGAPPDPSRPPRRLALAAVAAILERQGVRPAKIKHAMSEAHQAHQAHARDEDVLRQKPTAFLDDTDANKIRAEYPGLLNLDERKLLTLCDEESREVIRKYRPST